MTYALTEAERDLAVELLSEGVVTVPELAKELDVSRQSLQQLAERRGLYGLLKIRAKFVKELWYEELKAKEKELKDKN